MSPQDSAQFLQQSEEPNAASSSAKSFPGNGFSPLQGVLKEPSTPWSGTGSSLTPLPGTPGSVSVRGEGHGAAQGNLPPLTPLVMPLPRTDLFGSAPTK